MGKLIFQVIVGAALIGFTIYKYMTMGADDGALRVLGSGAIGLYILISSGYKIYKLKSEQTKAVDVNLIKKNKPIN